MGAQGFVQVFEGLEQESQAIGAHALGREEPRVEHEDGLHRRGALARAEERRVVVQPKPLTKPQHRTHRVYRC